ncbi:MAG TPA: hypothetical protein VND96_10725 [Candidatus Micrarchaeaceae archaeon]|nr:hypothetical protein [Candidatus Micrarchaeaceae archaeon]
MELEANIVQSVASRDGDSWRMERQNTTEMPTFGSSERRSEIHASRLPTLVADALLSLDQAGWSARNLEHTTSDPLGKILIRRALERMAAAADDLAALHELTLSGDWAPPSAS